MALRELLQDIHTKAEESEFATKLMSGNMDPVLYGLYLYNQFQIYSALENRAIKFPFYIKNLKGMGRMFALDADRLGYHYPVKMMPSTKRYMKYCENLTKEQVIAHLYVRHFGDMYGGQMISKKIPACNAEGKSQHTDGYYYKFDGKSGYINTIRSLLDDDMEPECRIVFQYAIDLFKELTDYVIPETYPSKPRPTEHSGENN